MDTTSAERTLISITETVALHESVIPSCVLAGSALSGCDSVFSFFNIGMKTMPNVLKSNPLNCRGEFNSERRGKEAFIAACYEIKAEMDFSLVMYKS